ncbi:hypothetical protein ABT288_30315 [Streptomyces sp. NPDC001093]|uniref:hypothetical protein n=1 Tax=Streptomyces sp. NPDC001093 TaxID=3154376 RepID=UPI00332CEC50
MGDSRVGGDIGTLRTMSDTYKNAKDKLDGVVKPLTQVVDKPATDASCFVRLKDDVWHGLKSFTSIL